MITRYLKKNEVINLCIYFESKLLLRMFIIWKINIVYIREIQQANSARGRSHNKQGDGNSWL